MKKLSITVLCIIIVLLSLALVTKINNADIHRYKVYSDGRREKMKANEKYLVADINDVNDVNWIFPMYVIEIDTGEFSVSVKPFILSNNPEIQGWINKKEVIYVENKN